MPLRFRLPADDEEDELDELPEPPKLPSPERARGWAFVGVGVVLACQILFPIALPFLLMFVATGAAAGALISLQEREAGLLGFVLLWFIVDVFLRPSADPDWVVRTLALMLGGLFLGLGVGLLIRLALAGHDD